MKLIFPVNGNIEIIPETDLEEYGLNNFLNQYHKKQSKIIIYETKIKSIKTEIKYSKGK